MIENAGHRIKVARKRLGLSLQAAGDAIGVSAQAVDKWERGGRIRMDNLTSLASVLKVTPDWILNKEGLNAINEPRASYSSIEPGPDIRGRVPLISWVQAGDWTTIADNLPPGDAEKWLPCPVRHGAQTFVLRVRGESMYNPHGRPSFQDGDLIFVDPDRQAEHGSLVIVRLDDAQDATFKKLVIEGDRKYLRALNPAWPEPIIQANGNATICGVVIGRWDSIA